MSNPIFIIIFSFCVQNYEKNLRNRHNRRKNLLSFSVDSLHVWCHVSVALGNEESEADASGTTAYYKGIVRLTL